MPPSTFTASTPRARSRSTASARAGARLAVDVDPRDRRPAPARGHRPRTSPIGSHAPPGSATIARSPSSRTSSSSARVPSTSPASSRALSATDVDRRVDRPGHCGPDVHVGIRDAGGPAERAGGVRARAAHPASGVGGDGQGVPGLAQRVVHEQPPDQRLADAGHELDAPRSPGPSRSPRTGRRARRPRRTTARLRRRLVREDAAVARPVPGPPHRHLAVEAVDRPPHVRHPQQHAGVVDEVARREVVGAVEHDVVVGAAPRARWPSRAAGRVARP